MERIEEVKASLTDFAQQHFADAPNLVAYTRKLWDQIGRKRNYVITGGTKEVWASAVVYVIARLNFLFDRSSPHYLPPDTICGFFGTKKGTVDSLNHYSLPRKLTLSPVRRDYQTSSSEW